MSGRAVIKASQMGEEMQSQAVRVAQDGMGLCNTENVRGRRARAGQFHGSSNDEVCRTKC